MEITLPRSDDFHLHLRDGAAMADIVGHSARQFGRVIVMPNLKPPVRTVADALAYRERILAALPEGAGFNPLMALYLTETTTPDDIARAGDEAAIIGVKLYPAGATTNADAGVADLARVRSVLEAMQRHDLPLLIHGEVTDPDVDVFDREAVFVDRVLGPLRRDFPALRIVLEHVTTRHAVDYVRASKDHLAATITPQHLLYNRNALFAGGLRPHYYCLPVLKLESDRQALVEAATGDDPRFFLGTDSAPHAQGAKESACGCAGIFSAHAALELYAEAFERAGALDRLAEFASQRGADFYRLPRNTGSVRLVKTDWRVPDAYPFGEDRVVPLGAGETINWKLSVESL
ncbi:MAG TPA: dihydroorotase [Gammaproteobacteria bacterium]|nr:dihydroorotase [Gammaproteobacteria bacterium]